ncbi:MAG: hypothetical protein JO364_05850 [Pseudonocardiales bacterium]|nr:hypothetical protein [Pseudonocardiales bacterium]MBV9029829.1 hypothetical protein [Pseudonocardiales bacterium]
MTLTSVINAIHHEQLSTAQRQALAALLLNLGAAYDGMQWCPEMSPVQTAYRELLAAGHAQWGADPQNQLGVTVVVEPVWCRSCSCTKNQSEQASRA